VEERMKYLSKLFATALVSLLAMGSVAPAALVAPITRSVV